MVSTVLAPYDRQPAPPRRSSSPSRRCCSCHPSTTDSSQSRVDSVGRSRSHAARAPCRARFRPPPSTDPRSTLLLWQQVRSKMSSERHPNLHPTASYARPTRASRNHENPPIVATSMTPSTPSTSISNTSTSATQSSARGARVTDKNFRDTILKQYGVVIDETVGRIWRGGPYRHFDTPAPPDEVIGKEAVETWYHQQHGGADSRVWLALDPTEAQTVASAYTQMVAAGEEEAKFQFYGLSHFFLQDEIHVPSSLERKRIAYCKLQWAPSPNGKLFQCPPLIQPISLGTGPPLFGFNINPDCTFWLTDLQFNPQYRDVVSRVTFVVVKSKVMTPYLTIEFKKSDSTLETAVNQIAAAASLFLYNRVALRAWRLRDTVPEMPLTKEYFADLVHYGIAFAGASAFIYQISPQLHDFTITHTFVGGSHGHSPSESDLRGIWAGCSVADLVGCFDVTMPADVLALRRWINELQNWGLGQYSKAVQRDVKLILSKAWGPEGDVSLLEDEVV